MSDFVSVPFCAKKRILELMNVLFISLSDSFLTIFYVQQFFFCLLLFIYMYFPLKYLKYFLHTPLFLLQYYFFKDFANVNNKT